MRGKPVILSHLVAQELAENLKVQTAIMAPYDPLSALTHYRPTMNDIEYSLPSHLSGTASAYLIPTECETEGETTPHGSPVGLHVQLEAGVAQPTTTPQDAYVPSLAALFQPSNSPHDSFPMSSSQAPRGRSPTPRPYIDDSPHPSFPTSVTPPSRSHSRIASGSQLSWKESSSQNVFPPIPSNHYHLSTTYAQDPHLHSSPLAHEMHNFATEDLSMVLSAVEDLSPISMSPHKFGSTSDIKEAGIRCEHSVQMLSYYYYQLAHLSLLVQSLDIVHIQLSKVPESLMSREVVEEWTDSVRSHDKVRRLSSSSSSIASQLPNSPTPQLPTTPFLDSNFLRTINMQTTVTRKSLTCPVEGCSRKFRKNNEASRQAMEAHRKALHPGSAEIFYDGVYHRVQPLETSPQAFICPCGVSFRDPGVCEALLEELDSHALDNLVKHALEEHPSPVGWTEVNTETVEDDGTTTFSPQVRQACQLGLRLYDVQGFYTPPSIRRLIGTPYT
ncbi:hypothetical protein SISSUDRAFT_1067002 [Sistotremastrum suecicum HHB10207 ss-3]|uniref:Uncharacterized protein n=1 Tax=Sistotremastrum suecicum HHB10207 ss-3 TaxID=1314776 RepID=A0A165XME4_9AGAM|nr:hypothetical protein SISSUDRAFT_1067002 [Sistotremastrum suecicum HHB10207 ss-3]